MKWFVVNYLDKTITLEYNDERFTFNLNDGDVGDFWDSFTDKHGILRDVNFYQEDKDSPAMLATYLIDDKNQIDFSSEESIRCLGMANSPNHYFN